MSSGIDLVKVPSWQHYLWLHHGFSARAAGYSTVYGGKDLNLGFTPEDDRRKVLDNRQKVVDGFIPGAALATLQQVHGVSVVSLTAAAEPVPADGMITDRAGIVLGIQVADCVPVLLADTRQRIVAALHAGWRGTVGGIVGLAIDRLTKEFGSRPEDLTAAIGPSIGPCCYQVGDELIDRVGWQSGLLQQMSDGVHFDLWEGNRQQLAAAGVRRVEVLRLCTACSRQNGQRRFFSHRAEAGKTGRAMGLIALSAAPCP